MRVGSELKAARKKAGLTVEVISKRTKINASKLVALEKDDFKNLPTGLYLFSTVRAYAREVQIDPEPIVERLRGNFADEDALDALHALDATGALQAKNLADAGSSTETRSNLLRNAAIAAGVMLMAAAGAGAYLRSTSRIAHEVRGATVERPSVPLPAPATPVASAVVPPQVEDAVQNSAPAKTQRPKLRTAAVTPELQEPVAAVDAVSEEPADTPATIEEVKPEAPGTATAP